MIYECYTDSFNILALTICKRKQTNYYNVHLIHPLYVALQLSVFKIITVLQSALIYTESVAKFHEHLQLWQKLDPLNSLLQSLPTFLGDSPADPP